MFEDKDAFMRLVNLDSGVIAEANQAARARYSWSYEERIAISLDTIHSQSPKEVRAEGKSLLDSLVDETGGLQSAEQAGRSSSKTTGGRE
ncbi:MAG: hypothetical protein NTV33_07595 [Coprothermobacterota bacterium]|nr:hypothetical protein [Coprothermobacterota bacterium]